MGLAPAVLVERYWWVVADVGRRHHTDAQPWLKEELLGVGYEALWQSARRWDGTRSFQRESSFHGRDDPFERFARNKINQAMIDEVRRLRPGARWKGRPAQPPASLTAVREAQPNGMAVSNTPGTYLTPRALQTRDDPLTILERREVIESTLDLLDQSEARALLARLLNGDGKGAISLGGVLDRDSIIAKLRAAAA